MDNLFEEFEATETNAADSVETEEATALTVSTIDRNARIFQSNSLVEGCYRLNDIEQRLLFMMISQLDQDAEELTPITLKIKDIADFCNFNRKSSYAQLIVACENLSHQSVRYRNQDGDFRWVNWFDEIATKRKKGLVTFQFHKKMTPDLIQLSKMKGGWTYMDSNLIGKLETAFAQRFYVFFLQYKDFGHRAFTIAQILDFFQLQNKYRNKNGSINITMLLKRVVFPAIDKINEVTPMTVRYELQRIGRQITGIDFWFKVRNTKLPTNIPEKEEPKEWRTRTDVANVCKRLVDLGVDGNQLNNIMSHFNNGDDFMIASESAITSLNNSKGIENPGGFLRKTIETYDVQQHALLTEAEQEIIEKRKEEKLRRREVIENAKDWAEIVNFATEQSNKDDAADVLKKAAEYRPELYRKFQDDFKEFAKEADPRYDESYSIETEIARMNVLDNIETLKVPEIEIILKNRK